MKIAFTSCANVQSYPTQPGWRAIQAHAPDMLLLLGDQIYMDFGWCPLGGDLYAPAKMSPTDFGKRMYQRYANQFNEPNWRALREALPDMVIAATWDDHDFAWNNACGGRPGEQEKDRRKHHVPDTQRWLAKLLFRQYLDAVRRRLADYPAPPADFDNLPSAPVPDAEGVQESFDVAGHGLRVVLLDTRYHRDCETHPDPRMVDAAQMSWLAEQLAGGQDFTLVCSGTTLSDGTCWFKQYPESYADLIRACGGHKVLVLSGDIHENAFRIYPLGGSVPPLYEAIASGLAVKGFKPFGWWGYQENYGLLEVGADTVQVRLFHNGHDHFSGRIARADWRKP
jgi:alkaline phosphatase D